MIELYDYILSLFQIPVNFRYYDFIVFALAITVFLIKIFNYDVPNYSYIVFFGLFPYRLIKAISTLPKDNLDISLWLTLRFFGAFCLIWWKINKIIPFVFGNFIGQSILLCTLFVLEKLMPLFNELLKRPILKGLLQASLILTLLIYLYRMEQPHFFFWSLFQLYLWYTNFIKHFLQGEFVELYKKTALNTELPKTPLDFKWRHLVGLMSFVSMRKHNCPISNKLGMWACKAPLSNIAERYLITQESTSDAIVSKFKANITTLVTVGSGIVMANIINFRIKSIATRVQNKKEFDMLCDQRIIQLQKEIKFTQDLANNYSQEYKDLQKKLEIYKNSFNPFKWSENKKNIGIENPDIQLDFLKIQYESKIDFIKDCILKLACIKKIRDSDVYVYKRTPLEKILTANKKDFELITDLGLRPEKLQMKAEKNVEIQAVLKEAFPLEGCPFLNFNKIEKLHSKIDFLVNPVFDEYKQEFIKETLYNANKYFDEKSNLIYDDANKVFYDDKDDWLP